MFSWFWKGLKWNPHDLPDFVTFYFTSFFYKLKYIDSYVCIITENLLKIKMTQNYNGGLDFLQVMCDLP